jgi:hypothetical protein
MKQGKALLIILSLAAMVLCGAGCSKLTKQNYDKLTVGMEYMEVTALLGDAPACDAAMGAKSCTWGGEQKNITVKFVADKVVFMTCKGI